MDWTVEMINFFKKLCRDEKSTFRAITETMNAKFGTHLSRNACIGKARRLSMPPRAAANNPVGKVTIYDLRDDRCKWVLGAVNARPPYLYCGEPTDGGSWCEEHKQLVFSRTSDIAKIYLPA
jgi:hypothetical protein